MGFIHGLLGGVFLGALTVAIDQKNIGYEARFTVEQEAVQHGYAHWCADYSFIWQHEECE